MTTDTHVGAQTCYNKFEMSDDEALFESLENEAEQATDPALVSLRATRMQAIAAEMARAKSAREEGFGQYSSITDEKILLDTTTQVKRCIVHFQKPDFNRCRIMDDHLQTLAQSHLETRIVRMDVQHAPFLVTKLGVKVLPCVIGFLDGISVDRIVGFEGLVIGTVENFETGILEKRLQKSGLLDILSKTQEQVQAHNGSARQNNPQEMLPDDDDDWD